MSRSFDVPELTPEEEQRLLNLFGFPAFDEFVTCPNIYGTGFELKAKLIRDTGDDYHARPELSHSQFVKFANEPEVFGDHFFGEQDPDAPEPEHFKFGKQVEHFLFHDEIPGNPVVIPNDKLSRRKRSAKWFEENQVEYDEANDDHHTYAKAGAAYKAFVKANDGRTVLTEKEFDALVTPLEKIRNNVREHSKSRALLYGESLRHLAIVFTCPFSGIFLRCQLDCLPWNNGNPCVVDYKTARQNDSWKFAAHFYDWKYHIQATWYREAVRQISGGDVLPVIYIVTEKMSKSFIVEVFNVHDDWYPIAFDEWQEELVHFEQCVKSQLWKRKTHNTIVDLLPPVYVTRQHERSMKLRKKGK